MLNCQKLLLDLKALNIFGHSWGVRITQAISVNGLSQLVSKIIVDALDFMCLNNSLDLNLKPLKWGFCFAIIY